MSRLTDVIEATVRRVVRAELDAMFRPVDKIRVRCARKGCDNHTQTGFPFCSSCRQGHKPGWKHPRLRAKGVQKCQTRGCDTLTGAHEFCQRCRKAIAARAA